MQWVLTTTLTCISAWRVADAHHLHIRLAVRQVATYRAFTLWRDPEQMSNNDKKDKMFQETFMIQELCERGDLQKQRPEAKAQLDKDYLR